LHLLLNKVAEKLANGRVRQYICSSKRSIKGPSGIRACESGNRKVTALTDRSHPKPIPQVSRGQMEKPGGVLQRSNPQGVLIRGTGGEQDG
jgi:hypothetical protein